MIEVPPELRENPLAEGFDVDRVRAEAEARSLQHLRELIPQDARRTGTVETDVRRGVAQEILKVAAERSVDLIVMGVQGRGALDLLLFGSNTARVSRARYVSSAHRAARMTHHLVVGSPSSASSSGSSQACDRRPTQPHAIRPAARLDQHRAR